MTTKRVLIDDSYIDATAVDRLNNESSRLLYEHIPPAWRATELLVRRRGSGIAPIERYLTTYGCPVAEPYRRGPVYHRIDARNGDEGMPGRLYWIACRYSTVKANGYCGRHHKRATEISEPLL
jgi:hypothetical protein